MYGKDAKDMVYIKAFIVGGLICGLIQVLMDHTKLLPGRIMVLLVCLGIVAGVFGIYKPLVDFAGAGASVPLLGFGNTLAKGVREAIKESGFLGIFTGGLKATAGGITVAVVAGLLVSLIFKQKDKS